MIDPLPRAWGELPGSARIRARPEDFLVEEQLGFASDGEGEHALLLLEKRGRNTQDIARALAGLAAVPERDIGFCGLKDRNAVTRQWFSVGLAGSVEPDWSVLESGADLRVLEVSRHRKKLRRGVHRNNRFTLVLRDWSGNAAAQSARLQRVRDEGVPNYFGEQRFGREGHTLERALAWMGAGGRLRRAQRSLYLSALRAHIFNALLAARLAAGNWLGMEAHAIAMLAGSRSFFRVEEVDDDLLRRVAEGDLHPGLPLWGRAKPDGASLQLPAELVALGAFLEDQGLALDYRAVRVIPD
ncbi:MAG: tRNA pseudouridine(13) synthase TruD, partial [Halioglobus sp.]|nr:tRNA pseudouridine(13) synthase TruD [Halioglobus sp.]